MWRRNKVLFALLLLFLLHQNCSLLFFLCFLVIFLIKDQRKAGKQKSAILVYAVNYTRCFSSLVGR